MDAPSRRKHGSRRSSNKSSSKPRISTAGRRKRKSENSKFFVSTPILLTCCNMLLFGMALWGSVSDNSTYNHIVLESSKQPELVTRRLGSVSPAESNVKNVSSTSTATAKQQQEETPSKVEEATTPANKLSTQKETISPISCAQQLANRKSDTTDPNRNLEESPYKHITLTRPNMYISLHEAKFDVLRWNSIYENGNYYENGITFQFRNILRKTPKKGLVIDVGMNIGWFTIYSRAMGHKVVGFDPNPIMHTRMCESLKLNGWLDDETVHSFAYGLGAEPATLELMTPGNNPGMGSFLGDKMGRAKRNKISVPVVTLDDVADQQGWITDLDTPIHLLKMDVEGYEYYVMEGAQKLLQSRRIRNIIMENSDTDIQHVVKMYTSLYKAGYQIRVLSGTHGGRVRMNTIPGLNKLLAEAGDNTESLLDRPEMLDFTRLTLNIWWELREENV